MGTPCRIFAVSPRADNAKSYWAGTLKSAELSEKYGLTGVLLFNGNDTYLETWVVAEELLRRTKSISPLVAVNPVYMHPFTVAKIIASSRRALWATGPPQYDHRDSAEPPKSVRRQSGTR